MPNWLRWVLILPAALVSYVGIQILVGLSSENLPLPDKFQDWYSQAANSVAGAWAFIYAGALTAPRGRQFPTGVALAVLFGVVTGSVLTLAASARELSHPLWWIALTALASLVTCIAACVQLRRRDDGEIGPSEHGDATSSPE